MNEVVLVCGDRNWTDGTLIGEALDRIQPRKVIHGGARGADTLAGEAARERGIEVIVYPAVWEQYHRAAGPIRNQEMLDHGKPGLVLAFHDNLDESKGTADMVRRARKRGVEVEVITH